MAIEEKPQGQFLQMPKNCSFPFRILLASNRNYNTNNINQSPKIDQTEKISYEEGKGDQSFRLMKKQTKENFKNKR